MTKDRKRAYALSLAEGQADSTREDMVEFLVDAFLNGIEPITDGEVVEWETESNEEEV